MDTRPTTPVVAQQPQGTATTTRTANYGAPISAPMSGNFPAVGSSLGPYFSVGRLGFGTFCSIHKCINLHYNHHSDVATTTTPTTRNSSNNNKSKQSKKKALRLVAAKVEIGDFKNSGVLMGEASILHFLDDVLPPHTVPTFMGHYVSTNRDKTTNKTVTSAIVMEYLTGQDMHKIREWSTRLQYKLQQQQQQQQQEEEERQRNEDDAQFSPQPHSNDYNNTSTSNTSTSNDYDYNNNNRTDIGGSRFSSAQQPRPRRRIAVNDAVYLTAHVMLPLLRKMHSVGIIHRDVKPSNVVKRSDCSSNKFCIVDFGLSKSIVVPHNSELANPKQVWKGSNWMGSSTPDSTMHQRPFELLSHNGTSSSNSSKNSNGASSSSTKACYRQERSTADFRGTSMYASARVHQLQDYCPRDDIWSLLYVFCDLAAGGLPWMSHAANKDRAACKILKERIHGLEAQADGELLVDTRRLLMGDEYHRALFKKRNGSVDPPLEHEQNALVDDDDDPNLPKPLALSEDKRKVGLLKEAFDHLKGLGYDDIPDYDLIQRSLEGFLEKNENETTGNDKNTTTTTTTTHSSGGGSSQIIPSIDWKLLSESSKSESKKRIIPKTSDTSVPTWEFINDGNDNGNDNESNVKDPLVLDSSIFAEAEASLLNGSTAEEENGAPLYGDAADLARLPMELRFRVSQMEYHTLHKNTIEPHLAMCDWLRVCLPLLYSPWNSKKYEKGGHRSNKDGYRREFFLKLVNKCLDCANKFGGFRTMNSIYDYDNDNDNGDDDDNDEAIITGGKDRPTKRRRRRRRIQMNNLHQPMTTTKIRGGCDDDDKKSKSSSDLLAISKVMFELRMTKQAEEKLSRAPPPRLSFGS
jgi:serine/threonine protein kinase